MKSQTANSPTSHNFNHGRPSSASFAVSEAMRQGSRIRFAKVRVIDNYELSPCSPTAEQSKHVLFENVAGLQGNRASASLMDETVKRFKVTVKDRVTGEPVEVLAKLVTKVVHVLSYGKHFTFTKSNRSKTVLDSRSGKRVSCEFACAELTRILGETDGRAKFAELVG